MDDIVSEGTGGGGFCIAKDLGKRDHAFSCARYGVGETGVGALD